MDQAGRGDYTVKVYPNGSHNLMEVPPDNPNEYVRLKRFPRGFFEMMVNWATMQVRRRHKSGVRIKFRFSQSRYTNWRHQNQRLEFYQVIIEDNATQSTQLFFRFRERTSLGES
jgi:hypothetical protein